MHGVGFLYARNNSTSSCKFFTLVCVSRIRSASMYPKGLHMLLEEDGREVPGSSPAEHGAAPAVCQHGAEIPCHPECCHFPRWVLGGGPHVQKEKAVLLLFLSAWQSEAHVAESLPFTFIFCVYIMSSYMFKKKSLPHLQEWFAFLILQGKTDLYFGYVLPEVCSSALLACARLDPQACGWALAQSQSYCLWKPLLLVVVHWLIGSMSYAPLPPSPRFVHAACFLCPVSWGTSSRQR